MLVMLPSLTLVRSRVVWRAAPQRSVSRHAGAMFVNRMMNDPDFAARIHARQAAQAETLGGCPLGAKRDVVSPSEADAYLAADADAAPPPISEEEDAAWRAVRGREGEVRVVSQGLAFCGVGAGAARGGGLAADAGPMARPLATLLRDAYADEEAGPEAFRDGKVVDEATVAAMLADGDVHWTTIEAANGRDADEDGALLGAACVSFVGARAELRFFAVRPRYRGLCVGQRLLARVERLAAAAGAKQLVACVPSPRASVAAWAERRGFACVAEAPFPAASLPFAITRGDAKLRVFAKPLGAPKPPPPPGPPKNTRLPEIGEGSDDDGGDDLGYGEMD